MKFFRRIRQQLLKNNRIRNYFFYAIGEIVLVVVGILLALQINNWNENRKRQALKDNYLQSLRSDLKDDLEGLNTRLEFEEENIEQLRNFKNRLSSAEASVDTLKQIARYEFHPFIYPPSNFSNSTYNALIATGDIDLLNPSLIQSLNELYKLQKESSETMEWSSNLYRTHIGAYARKYTMNIEPTTISDGPLNKEIWKNVDTGELASELNGVTGLKRNQHRVAKDNLRTVLEKTKEVLKELGE
jgi:uncharacterized protein YnzC (UPF0291/DUF896 family)